MRQGERETIHVPDEKRLQLRQKLETIRSGYEYDPSIREVIDFLRQHEEVIESMLKSELRKSGAQSIPDVLRYPFFQFGPEQWKQIGMGRASAAYLPTARAFALNDSLLRAVSEESSVPRLNILHCIIHEICHSVSYENLSRVQTQLSRIIHLQKGLTHFIGEEDQPEWIPYTGFFELLNEAVNDELAEKITRALALTTGFCSKQELSAFYDVHSSLDKPYGRARDLLAGIVHAIAHHAGMETRVVHEAFKRAALAGDNIEDIKNQLEGIFGKGFYDALSKLGSNAAQVTAFKRTYGID